MMKKSKQNIKPESPSAAEVRKTPGFNHSVVIGVVLFFISFIVYFNTLGHGFVLDDPLAIELNKNVTSGASGIGNIIKGGYRENNFGGQLYRPISLIQFALEWQISPNDPKIHHFFSVLWYALSVVLLFLVFKRWLKGYTILIPAAIALIFAVHPIHTEVVANIKSRDEIMSLFFVLAAFFTYQKYLNQYSIKWLISSVCLYFLAIISKESAVTMFPVFGMVSWWVGGNTIKKSLAQGIWFVIPVLILFAIRASIFGSQPAPATDIMDNPIVSANGWGERFPTAMVILLKYLTLQIFPHPLACDYSYKVIPVTGFSNPIVWIAVLAHCILAIIFFKGLKTRSLASFFIAGYMLAIALFSQLPIIIGTMFGERLAYLASFWFIGSMIYVVGSAVTKRETEQKPFKDMLVNNGVFVSIVIVISLLFAFKTITRNEVWKDNFTLFTTDSDTHPESVRLHNGAADQLIAASNKEGISQEEISNLLTKAENHCNAILKIRPVPTAYLTLGNIRLKQQNYEEAIKYYDQVNDLKDIVNQNKALAFRELGRHAGEKEQNLSKSQEMLTKALQHNEKDPETWYLLGVSYGVAGNHQKAAENFEKAYQLKPTPEYAKSVVAAYQNLGNTEKVRTYQQYTQ